MTPPTWLEVKVYNGWFDLVEVLERVKGLEQDGASLPLRDALLLFQEEVQVVAIHVLQHRAESRRG